MLDLLTSKSKNGLQTCIGFVIYGAEFLPHLAIGSALLTDLLSQNEFEWRPLHEEAFSQIKHQAKNITTCIVHKPSGLKSMVASSRVDWSLGNTRLEAARVSWHQARTRIGKQARFSWSLNSGSIPLVAGSNRGPQGDLSPFALMTLIDQTIVTSDCYNFTPPTVLARQPTIYHYLLVSCHGFQSLNCHGTL